jgi:AcrR family transcriptional regulator
MSDRVKLHSNSDDVKPPRRYVSSLRDEQARVTRFRILDAARELFIERGFAGTSIEVIAREAGVAVQTIYSAFGNKQSILARVMDQAIGGDDQQVAVLDRPERQSMRDEPDQRAQLRSLAHGIRRILERAGPIFAVMRAAAPANPEIADLYGNIQEERLQNMTRVLGWISQHGPLREGLTERTAADILWTLTSADIYNLLVTERGWTGEQYTDWLADTLIAGLLPQDSPAPGKQEQGNERR